MAASLEQTGTGRQRAKALEDSIHAAAQPLTALIFLLDLGLIDADPQAWHTALSDARTECLRAIAALEDVRNAAHALTGSGETI